MSYLVAMVTAPILTVAELTVEIIVIGYLQLHKRQHRKELENLKPDRHNPVELAHYQELVEDLERIGNKGRVVSRIIIFGPIITVFVGFLIIPNLWLPSEEISIKNAAPINAYVLSTSPNFTAVLLAHTSQIEYIATNSMTKRQLCDSDNITNPIEQSLPEIISTPKYPSCSSLRKKDHND